MTDDNRLRLLYDVARMHYSDKLTNTEIANKVGVSSTHVARLLAEAERNQVVEIYYHPPRLYDLESRLRARFPSLREVLVVPATTDSESNLKTLGSAAATYFDARLGADTKVGISGGNTVHEMVVALPERKRPIEIYPTQLIGRGPHIPEHKDPIVLINDLWERSGRNPDTAYYATIPPIERDRTKRSAMQIGEAVRRSYEELRSRGKIEHVWQRMHEVEIVFASIGQLLFQSEQRRVHGRTLLNLFEDMGISADWLAQEGIVGDVSYSLFDRNGNTKTPRWDFFMALGVDHFKKMAAEYPKRRVVLIVGERKANALRAALAGGICNVLITLESVGEEVLAGG